ncbi:uncharacterized protein LOC111002133 [Pieris rapae]|uniref:uncharacterized protein LOC111002133 n=1 Tax=Pieris rapae TaxID=64459 RepID=UPI001E27FE71|nr:uncharacterized protein LOC111002133 [Pieris rapae]
MTFHKKHPKKEMARDKVNRIKRSNPFKILKDIVLRNRYTDTNNKVRKLFDYDVVTTSSNYNFVNHNNQLSKIEALLGQVPNITSKLESHDYDQYYYLPNDLSILHNKGLYTTKERTLFISNELPLLPDLPLEPTPQNPFTYNGLDKTNYFDDIINIRVKAASDQETKSTFNSEERKKIDPLLENLLGSITAENFPSTENIQNNYVNHDTEREVEAMSDIYKTNIKKIQPNKYSYKLILYNDNKKENELRNMDPRYGNQQVLSKRAKSRNIFTHRKVPEKTVPHNKTDTKGSHKISSKLQKPQPANNVKKQKKPKILPTTKMQKQQKAHPDHFFTTPLPMSDNEFNKFLEDNNIDVQSVTAPLPNYIPFSTHVMHIVSKLKPYKNNIPNIGKKNNRKHGTKQNNYNLYIQRQRKKRDKIWKKNKSPKLSGKPVLEPEITFTPKNKMSVKV